jgi:hypothetical protein
LGERFNGIEEVVGSIPSGSTILINNLDRKCQENLVVSRAKSPPRRHRLRKRPSLSEAMARAPIAAIVLCVPGRNPARAFSQPEQEQTIKV